MSNNRFFDIRESWYIAHDPDNIGKTHGWENRIHESAIPAYVPSIIQQFLPECHGVAYYWCSFTPQIYCAPTDRISLDFGGADYKAEVWLNGIYLGAEEGGETPFSFDVTDSLKIGEENLLAVRIVNPTENFIDGLTLQNTPHRNKEVHKCAGCNLNHGGIWYGVSLRSLPAIYIKDKLLEGNIHDGSLEVRLELYSYANKSSDATVTVSIYESGLNSATVAQTCSVFNITDGDNVCKCSLTVPSPKLWSIDDPYLYRICIIVDSEYGKDSYIQNYGFREFCIKDGFFYLNGKRIYLRSSHSGNAFPIGQMFPVRPEHVRKDFIYAKAAGFNMIRCISGLYRPEQMDIADEMGMLIYDECFASWCMSYSAVDSWRNDKEFDQMLTRHPAIPVGDEKAMLDRWVRATEQMIKRDRNRTSVVVWGMLNETYPSSVFNTAQSFLPQLRELDPTRAVILNSGRWDNDYSIGSASNPYSNVWENTWGDDGDLSKQTEKMNGTAVGDTHFYPVSPICDADIAVFRNLGKNTKYPQFLSEFGVGSQFHVIEEYKHFMQYGERLDLEDAWWLKYQSEALTKDFERLELGRIFPFPEAMLKESQRINADERKRHFDMIRSNPRLAGYSLTGLLDHGMCGEGLWSYWRRWKPEMFDAISEGWAPLRFCLFATPNSYRGEILSVECVLANDSVLKSGTYTADFAITGENGVLISFSESFELDVEQLAVPVMKKNIEITLPEGKYKLVASLREGSPAATSTHFYVLDRALHKDINQKVTTVGIDNKFETLLGNAISAENDCTLILAGNINKKQTEELLDRAKSGNTVVFMNAEIFNDGEIIDLARRVVPDLTLTHHRDWLYHKEYILYDNMLFDGLGNGLMELLRFRDVFAHSSFITDQLPDYIGCPGFWTGYYGVHLGYGLTYALMGFNYGKGRVIFNSFDLLDKVGNPVADRLITNLLNQLK